MAFFRLYTTCICLPLFALIACTPAPELSGLSCTESFALDRARNAHVQFFDPRLNSLVIYGGADHEKVCGDMWQFRTDIWQPLDIPTPGPRTFAAAASTDTGTVYVFGGNKQLFLTQETSNNISQSSLLNDLWVWENGSWREITQPGVVPVARAEAAMTFDSSRQRLVLFGGYTSDGDEIQRLRDTWEWNGRAWELMSNEGPAAQNGAVLAYDSARNISVLFGQNQSHSESWEWNGTTWSLTETNLPIRYNTAMAFADNSRELIRFSGWNSSTRGRPSETLLYSEQSWQLLNLESPPARNHSVLSYDQSEQRLLLYGGHNGDEVFADIWAFKNQIWRQISSAPPVRRSNFEH